MNQKERVEAFLKELTELTRKYELTIKGEGSAPYLYDTKEDDYSDYFIYSMSEKYEAMSE